MNQPQNKIWVFLSQTMTGTAVAIFAMSVIGVILGDSGKGISTMYRLGSQGLPYDTMLQTLILVTLIQLQRVFIFSQAVFKRMLILWRTILLLATGLLTTSAFSVLFGWIPADSLDAWLGLVISYCLTPIITAIIMLISTKRKDQKYDKLLADYKAKQRKESGE